MIRSAAPSWCCAGAVPWCAVVCCVFLPGYLYLLKANTKPATCGAEMGRLYTKHCWLHLQARLESRLQLAAILGVSRSRSPAANRISARQFAVRPIDLPPSAIRARVRLDLNLIRRAAEEQMEAEESSESNNQPSNLQPDWRGPWVLISFCCSRNYLSPL